MKHALRFLLPALALMWAAAAESLEIPLQYHRPPPGTPHPRPNGTTRLHLQIQPPEGTWKWPEFKSPRPLYVMTSIGRQERILVLDRLRSEDAFYTRAYFDANANRDLTDDPPLDGTLEKQRDRYVMVAFDPIDTTAQVGEHTLPYCFSLRFQCWDQTQFEAAAPDELNRFASLVLLIHCQYTGTFALSNQTYYCQILDTDGNGCFTNRGRVSFSRRPPADEPLYPVGDWLGLSTSTNLTWDDRLPLSDQLWLAHQLYDLDLVPDMSRMVLRPVTDAEAGLQPAAGMSALALSDAQGQRLVILYASDPVVYLAPGDYRLLNYRCRYTNEAGDVWGVEASGSTAGPVVHARRGRVESLPLGEPYQPMVEIPPWRLQQWQADTGNVLTLAFAIYGAGGEILSGLSCENYNRSSIEMSPRYRNRPLEPTYKVLDARGEIVAHGSFEYG